MDTVTTLALPIVQDLGDFFGTPNAFRSVLLLIISLVFAYIISNYIAKLIIKFAQTIAQKSDSESNDERVIRLRQVETYLSVAVAVVRASGLPHRTTSMFTEVEGEWDELMALVKAAVDAVQPYGSRVSLVLKADIRPGYTGELDGKIERLERAIDERGA